MIDLAFRIDDIVSEPYAAVPQLTARLEISERSGEKVHALALRCQVRIEPQRRGYDAHEIAGLADQFGPRERWSQTLKPFLWMHCSTMVQGFSEMTLVELPMPVTYDLEVTASKYLHQLGSGEVPLVFMFSGTCFTQGSSGIRRRAGALASRGLLPDACRGLARVHGPALSRQRLAATEP